MSRDCDFITGGESIRGMFWMPDSPGEQYHGILYLEAGKPARLETAQFNFKGLRNFFPGTVGGDSNGPVKLMGEEVTNAMRPVSRKVIHGHDDHGVGITLVDCYASSGRTTLAMSGLEYSCSLAIFGGNFSKDDIKFDAIRLHFDYLDQWVGRRAFDTYREDEVVDGKRRLARVVIPIARQQEISLDLPGYERSEFYCAWRKFDRSSEVTFKSRVFLELHFGDAKEWKEIFQEIHQWRWLLSLAMRTAVDVRSIDLYRDDLRDSEGAHSMEACPVWMGRRKDSVLQEDRSGSFDFHFEFSDIERNFSDTVAAWQRMQSTWAAVLHRFFAVADRRGLWVNEVFLFLAQAIESLYRARGGLQGGSVNFDAAAKDAYLKAPQPLQSLLGNRGLFVRQLCKSRNYWVHYGSPGPADDLEILSGSDLQSLNEKLRWIVESAILEEIKVPPQCVENVWSPQRRSRIVEYY